MFIVLSAAMLIVTLACAAISLPMGELFVRMAPGLINAVQAVVQNNFPSWVWEDLVTPLLMQRIWVIPGFLTVFFALGELAKWLRPNGSDKLSHLG